MLYDSSSSEKTITKPVVSFKHNKDKVNEALSIGPVDFEDIGNATSLLLGEPLDDTESMSEMIEVFLTFLNNRECNNEFKAIAFSILFMNILQEAGLITHKE